jgi:uncharacterized membrane protein
VFIGHYAVAFGSKRYAPRTSLGTLLAAALFLDLLWPVFLFLGWERVRIDPGNTRFTPLAFDSYPISHSLLAALSWAALFGGGYLAIRGYRRGAIAVAAGTLSHWVLDAASHRPDMPLYPGGPKVGLGLWYSVPGTILVETALFAVGLFLYLGATKARDRVGTWGLAAFVLVTMAMYGAAAFGPPPPSVPAIEVSTLGIWLVLLWAMWIDRHRRRAA